MIYLTFLGTGANTAKKKGYSASKTYFLDDEQGYIETEFVQVAVAKKHLADLSKVLVVATKTSKEMNYDSLHQQLVNVGVKGDIVSVIEVEEDIQFEDFVKSVSPVLVAENKLSTLENKDLLIDFTHGFRYMPLVMMMVVQYFNAAYGLSIKHLYYGKVIKFGGENGELGEVAISDFRESLHQSELTQQLHMFNQTLQLPENFPENQAIKTFKHYAKELNRNFSCSEEENAAISIMRIHDEIIKLQKEPALYLYYPFLSRIEEKFKAIATEAKKYAKGTYFTKYALDLQCDVVLLLLNHGNTQTSITFCDQLIRKLLVKACFPQTQNYREVLQKLNLEEKDFFELTQCLKNVIVYENYLNKTTNRSNKRIQFKDMDLLKKIDFTRVENSLGDKLLNNIEDFYDIRNNIHHGKTSTSVDCQQSVEEIVQKVILGIKTYLKNSASQN